MDDQVNKHNVQADHNSIAIHEINISGTVTGNITIGHTNIEPADASLRRDLGVLLKNVQTTWIKGVLEKSVHEATLLELGMELREEAVDNPWRMIIESPDRARQTLPRGRKIKDIFDEANRLLLILGEPGSGKTTTLLQLARDLIAEVDQTFTQPVPVILNLSTWTNKQQGLDEWLVGELNSKYRVPKKNGQNWLRERRILPLLDGLDETKVENRTDCVEKINKLVEDYGLPGLVVCSRIKDYMTLNVRLGFYRAIYLQPLAPEQVDEYLRQAGGKLASLRSTLQADEALRSMARSPLILNIMSLAYQGTSAKDLSDSDLTTDKARRKHLFDTYIARMFNRKMGEQGYDYERTKQQLSWLARNMQRHNQEVFLIENLQPSWLQLRSWPLYYVLTSRLIAALLMVGLSGGLIFQVALSSGLTEISSYQMASLMLIALLAGLAVGLIDVFRLDWSNKWRRIRNFPIFWWVVINIAFISSFVGLIIWTLGNSTLKFGGVINLMESGLIIGLLFGIIFGLRSSRRDFENDVQTVEALRWSWGSALGSGLKVGCIVFLLVAMFSICTATTRDYIYLTDRFVIPLIGGLVAVLVSVIFFGLQGEIIETKSVPNQGIRLSIRNAVRGGLFVGLIIGPIIELLLITGYSTDTNVITGMIAMVAGMGTIGTLWYGGLDVIQHYTLRLIFFIKGYTPANYTRFLDDAVDRIFLQKVGGGYRFIHRLLLEHFAEMSEATKKA